MPVTSVSWCLSLLSLRLTVFDVSPRCVRRLMCPRGCQESLFVKYVIKKTTQLRALSSGERARRAAIAVVVVAPLLLSARVASAQVIHGRVTDALTGVAVPGVVVLAMDRQGGALATGLSNATGEFQLARAPGIVALHLRRLGFRPLDVAVAPVDSMFAVTMTQLPLLLGTVHVDGGSPCDRAGARTSVADLWQQIRSGLLASVVDQ